MTAAYALITTVASLLLASTVLATMTGAIKESNRTNLAMAVGASLATMLILALTLSLIPVERTVEKFTPTVTNIYARDRTTQLIYFLLAMASLVAFASTLGALFGSSGASFIVLFGLFGAGVDLLRWHHRQVVRLLQPRQALLSLWRAALRYLNRTQRRAQALARHQWLRSPTNERQERQPEDFETALYLVWGQHARPLQEWTDDLREIACRSIDSGETETARQASFLALRIVGEYLAQRQLNLMPQLTETPFVLSHDAAGLVQDVLDEVTAINRRAISKANEVVALGVLEGLAEFISNASQLQSPRFKFGGLAGAVLWQPVGTFAQTVAEVHAADMVQVGYRASQIVVDIVRRLPATVRLTDAHLRLIERCLEDSRVFLLKGRVELVEGPLNSVMMVLAILVLTRHFEWETAFKHVFAEIESFAPIAGNAKAEADKFDLFPPLRSVYSVAERTSLPKILSSVVARVEGAGEDDRDRWVKVLVDLVELFGRHFRQLAENVRVDRLSFLMMMCASLREICRASLVMMGGLSAHEEERFSGGIRWLFPFYWVVAHRSKALPHPQATELCRSLAFVGLEAVNANRLEIADDVPGHLQSVIVSFREKGGNAVSPAQLSDLMMELWFLREVANQRNFTGIVRHCDEVMNRLIEEAEDAVRVSLEERKDRFASEDAEREGDWRLEAHESVSYNLAKKLLGRRGV